jgi:hypothetical protein
VLELALAAGAREHAHGFMPVGDAEARIAAPLGRHRGGQQQVQLALFKLALAARGRQFGRGSSVQPASLRMACASSQSSPDGPVLGWLVQIGRPLFQRHPQLARRRLRGHPSRAMAD